MTETKIAPKTRIIATDAIRTLAIGLVLLSHSAEYYVRNSPASTPTFWVSSAYFVFAKMGVPLFMMVTGVLLLSPQKNSEPIGEYLKKRVNAVLLPFIVWSLLFYFYFAWAKHTSPTLGGFIQAFLSNGISDHLWFLYTLTGIYLLVPLFRTVLPHINERMLKYFLILWFLSFSIIPLANAILHLKIQLGLIDMAGYSGFVILGYYLYYINHKFRSKSLLIFAIAMLTLNGVMGWFSNLNAINFVGYYYVRTDPWIVISAIAVFLWIINLDFESIFIRYPLLKTTINSIGRHSLSIYLFHWMVLNFFWYDSPWFRIMPKNFFNIALGIPLYAVMLMVISISAREIFSRIPVIKSIWP
jgi:surface polysaccharide O-acyltransferase-like enzyme